MMRIDNYPVSDDVMRMVKNNALAGTDENLAYINAKDSYDLAYKLRELGIDKIMAVAECKGLLRLFKRHINNNKDGRASAGGWVEVSADVGKTAILGDRAVIMNNSIVDDNVRFGSLVLINGNISIAVNKWNDVHMLRR